MGEPRVKSEEIQKEGLISEALREIREFRPGIDPLLKKHGTTRLENYSSDILGKGGIRPEDELHPERVEQFAEIAARHAAVLIPVYGENIVNQVRHALIRDKVVNTGVHHGIFTHPYFAGDLVFMGLGKSSDDVIVTIGDTSTPLGNPTYPAGMYLTETRFDKHSQADTPVRLHLSPSNLKTASVAAQRFTSKELAGAKSLIGMYKGDGTLSKDKAGIVNRVITQLAETSGLYDVPTFSDQTSIANALLFPKMFANDMKERLPKAVTLDSDRVMADALDDLLDSHDSLFTALLCNPDQTREFVAMTRQIDIVSSTDLFYTTDINGEKVSLELSEDGQTLIGKVLREKKGLAQTQVYPLTSEGIRAQLRNGNFYPGAGLQFAMLAYYGIDSLGGFQQAIGYLPTFNAKYAEKLSQWGYDEEADRVKKLDPLRISTTISLVFAQHGNKALEGAGLLDIAAKQNPDRSRGLTEEDVKQLGSLTVNEIIRLNIPKTYSVVVPRERQRPELQALTVEEIANTIGIEDKLVVV